MWYYMQIRRNLGNFKKYSKNAKHNICGQTTFAYRQIFAPWPQKGHVPNPVWFKMQARLCRAAIPILHDRLETQRRQATNRCVVTIVIKQWHQIAPSAAAEAHRYMICLFALYDWLRL